MILVTSSNRHCTVLGKIVESLKTIWSMVKDISTRCFSTWNVFLTSARVIILLHHLPNKASQLEKIHPHLFPKTVDFTPCWDLSIFLWFFLQMYFSHSLIQRKETEYSVISNWSNWLVEVAVSKKIFAHIVYIFRFLRILYTGKLSQSVIDKTQSLKRNIFFCRCLPLVLA